MLVIGGTLFLGRELVRRLLERGRKVILLHRGKHSPFAGETEEIACDRNDAEAMAKALAGLDVEAVFDNVYDWARGTTAEQVEAAVEATGPSARYLFTSSVAAYGTGLDHEEDDALAPPDDPDSYCRNKAETERMLFTRRGARATTFRPPYIFGPENPFYREQFFFDRLMDRRPILIPGDGSRLMQFIYRDDYVSACLAALDNPEAAGRAYNVGYATAITQRELVEALGRAAGVEPEMVYVPREKLVELGGQQFQPPYYFAQYYDMEPITMRVERAERELGFTPTPFEEALAKSFAWYEQQEERPAPDYAFDDRVLESL
ncbi:MAG: NAD-dependent epimerase/dehydratase family protein [Bryobacterales bacterium]|nr:NAD-dependent epimerase/dehydratase family protein [Acidobacteriota bacterium]MCB9384157.1 NAD-dependent epimerase/dehydratase family protein [Bryobacterales bacterium]